MCFSYNISFIEPLFFVCVGVGHRGYRAEAEEGADWSESLGQSSGRLPEPPVQWLISDHQGRWKGGVGGVRTHSTHLFFHCPVVA